MSTSWCVCLCADLHSKSESKLSNLFSFCSYRQIGILPDYIMPLVSSPYRHTLGFLDCKSYGTSPKTFSIVIINIFINWFARPWSFVHKYAQFHCSHTAGKQVDVKIRISKLPFMWTVVDEITRPPTAEMETQNTYTWMNFERKYALP